TVLQITKAGWPWSLPRFDTASKISHCHCRIGGRHHSPTARAISPWSMASRCDAARLRGNGSG
ncbi:MAG: hypothetical protein AAF625_19770, partial [Pseudomonadota bacterium]